MTGMTGAKQVSRRLSGAGAGCGVRSDSLAAPDVAHQVGD